MAKPTNKGFTLVEVLIVMSIMSALSMVIMRTFRVPKYTHINPQVCQLRAMATRKKCRYLDTLTFNYNGNINHAQTVKIKDKKCTFQLGFGRFKCE